METLRLLYSMGNSYRTPQSSPILALALVLLVRYYIISFLHGRSGSATVSSSVANNIAKITIVSGSIVGVAASSCQCLNSSRRLITTLFAQASTRCILARMPQVRLRHSNFTVPMASNVTVPFPAEPAVGELRFIARLSKAALPNGVNFGGVSVAEINGGTAIEGEDVFNVGGQTRSKFYSSKHNYRCIFYRLILSKVFAS